MELDEVEQGLHILSQLEQRIGILQQNPANQVLELNRLDLPLFLIVEDHEILEMRKLALSKVFSQLIYHIESNLVVFVNLDLQMEPETLHDLLGDLVDELQSLVGDFLDFDEI